MNRRYRIEPSRPPPPIPQPCGKCASFEHETDKCKATIKCSKCLGQHPTQKCTSPLPPKCSSCSAEDHTAWSLKCPNRPTAPIPGIPNMPIKCNNKKSADLPPHITKKTRIHSPLTIHDYIITTYVNKINQPSHTNREDLIKKLKKRFTEDFQIDTTAVFSGNRLYILMFDLADPDGTSPTEPTHGHTYSISHSNNNGGN